MLLAVDDDAFDVSPRHRPLAFPFDPLCEGREATLERLLCLALALRRPRSRRGGRGRLDGLDAQLGQPFLLIGRQLRPRAWVLLPLQPSSDVVAVEGDAGVDVRQDAVGVDEVGQDAVVALPVEWPGAVPVRVDLRELRRKLLR